MSDDFLKSYRKVPSAVFIDNLQSTLITREKRSLENKKMALAGLSLLLALALLTSFSSSVRARIVEIIQNIGGVQFAITEDYPGGDEQVVIVDTQAMTLEEAQSIFPSPISLPTYVPESFERNSEVELLDFNGNLPMALITWQKQEGTGEWSIIQLSIMRTGNVMNYGRPVGNNALEETTVNGKPAAIVRGSWNYDSKQYELNPYGFSPIELLWRYADNTVYSLRSDEQEIKVAELVKIAESIP